MALRTSNTPQKDACSKADRPTLKQCNGIRHTSLISLPAEITHQWEMVEWLWIWATICMLFYEDVLVYLKFLLLRRGLHGTGPSLRWCMSEHGAVMELGEEPVPVPLFPPENPTRQTWARTRTTAVKSKQLTAWAMAGPFLKFLCQLFGWGNWVKLRRASTE